MYKIMKHNKYMEEALEYFNTINKVNMMHHEISYLQVMMLLKL